MEEDNKLYDLLNVARNASDAELKKVSVEISTCEGVKDAKSKRFIISELS
jgi:hypothetical protein